MKRTSRIPCQLSESLHQRLNSYTLAASAAGVSLLALAQPAEAKIVYTHAHVTFGGGVHGKFGGSYYLDLNHDGIRDFEFGWSGISSYRSIWDVLLIKPTGSGNGIAGMASSWNYAFCLESGASIGPKQPFAGTVMGSIRAVSGGHGLWINPNTNAKGSVEGYLGLKFD